MIDLLVAGGGPAGLVTALYARHAGLDVAVMEPRAAPIDKACGEGLMPGAVRALAGLGVVVGGHPLAGIRYLAGTRRAEASFRDIRGAGVRRTELHTALDRARAAAGIPLYPQAVTRVRQQDDSVRAGGIRARYLAAADGLHSPIRTMLGLHRVSHAPRRWGLRAHFDLAPWTDHVEVYWSGPSEAYVTPVDAHRVDVAVLTGCRGDFGTQLAAFPELVARLPAGAVDGVRAAGPLRQRVRHCVAGRVLLVGDAGGYVDALTGEGLGVAFRSAAELVAAVAADAPERYEAAARRVSRRYRLLTHALVRAAAVPPLRARIVPAAAAMPRAFQAAVDALAH